MLSKMQAEDQMRRAIDAVRANRPADCLEMLIPLLAPESPIPQPWFLVAQASRLAGDEDAAGLALEKLLEREPEHLGGLLMLASRADSQGREDQADMLFRRAIAAANRASAEGRFPPALGADVNRAVEWVNRYQAARQSLLDEQVRNATGHKPSALIEETLAILKGDAQIQLQQPHKLYVPGLPQIAFYERERFDWVADVEALTAPIRAECQALLEERGGFDPYIPARYADEGRNAPNAHLVGKEDWGAFHLLKDGSPVAGQADRCPAALQALRHADQPAIPGHAPMGLFSLLRPGAHIKPHHGLFNHRLICHLPLIVPGQCTLRVGNHIRDWEEGRLLIFDDSVEHEAWNRSSQLRVVLLFEIWRPEISADDRLALTALISATSPASED
nr:aspartyl/asparaginyl beta-hydroxylase domain-containing protein [uncultured Sphingomonas sp.]